MTGFGCSTWAKELCQEPAVCLYGCASHKWEAVNKDANADLTWSISEATLDREVHLISIHQYGCLFIVQCFQSLLLNLKHPTATGMLRHVRANAPGLKRNVVMAAEYFKFQGWRAEWI